MGKFFIQDMARLVADKHGLSQQESEAFVSALFDVINEGLHGEKVVKVKGLGTFKVIDVRERESVNVNTGERVTIESHGKITFTPDPIMRDLVNKPFAQFDTVVLNDGVDLDEISKIKMPDDSDTVDDGDACKADVEECAGDDEEETASGGIEETLQNYDNDRTELQEEAVVENQILIGTGDTNAAEEVRADNQSAQEGGEVCREEATDTTVEDGKRQMPHDEDCEQVVDNEAESAVNDNDLQDCAGKNHVSCYKVLMLSVCALFIGAICLAIGYYWGRSSVKPVVRYKTVHIIDKSGADVVRKDSLSPAAAKSPVNENKPAVDSTLHVKGDNKEAPDKGLDKKAKPESVSLRNARIMVNTGAYKIVGTAKTVIVKKGETLKKISKFYFGDGMECYVQVHNGIDDVTEGMRLKIPKLKLKK